MCANWMLIAEAITLYSKPPIYSALIYRKPRYTAAISFPLNRTKDTLCKPNKTPIYRGPRITVDVSIPPNTAVNRGFTVIYYRTVTILYRYQINILPCKLQFRIACCAWILLQSPIKLKLLHVHLKFLLISWSQLEEFCDKLSFRCG